MEKLLHIIATPRGEDSRTLKVSKAFLDALNEKYPELKSEMLNVFTDELPSITAKNVEGKFTLLAGKGIPPELKEAWSEIEAYINQFLDADMYLISTPMWNFTIPYRLKHYIDLIVQPQYLFTYTEEGPQGLVKGKKMVVITSRGGDYSPDSPAHNFDYQEPYLRSIFQMVGIEDITFVHAQPMDALGEEVRNQKIEEARREARESAASL